MWNDTTLERWLADPDALVPDNNMEFQGSAAAGTPRFDPIPERARRQMSRSHLVDGKRLSYNQQSSKMQPIYSALVNQSAHRVDASMGSNIERLPGFHRWTVRTG